MNVLRQPFGDITSSHEEVRIAYGRLINRVYMHKCKLNYCLKQKRRPKKEKSDKAGANTAGKDGKANEAAAKPEDGQEQKKDEEADKGVSIGGKRLYCRFGFPASVVGYKYTWKQTPNGDIISNVRRQFTGEPDDGPIDEERTKHVMDDANEIDEIDAILNAVNTETAESEGFPSLKFPDGAGFVPITVQSADGVEVLGYNFFMLRNHPRINGHIPEVALAWQGNTDTKFIYDCDQVTAYLNKYINKPEPRSADQSKIARAAASDVNEDRPARKGIQQILLQTINREISKQECYLQLNNKHGYHKLALPVKPISLSGQKAVLLNHLNDPDAPVTKKNSMADIYWRREEDPNYQTAVAEFEADAEAWKAKAHSNWATPKHPKDVSLHMFVAYFNEKWQFHKREYIPCFSPRLKIVPRSTNFVLYEMYCRTRLLQFKPGATPTNLLDMRSKFVREGIAFFFEHVFTAAKKLFTLHLGKLWKTDGGRLMNKAEVWESTDAWNLIPNNEGTLFYITNTSDNDLVLARSNDEVIPKVKSLDDDNKQLWIKGEDDPDGFFTLENVDSAKVLTATSASDLRTKGMQLLQRRKMHSFFYL